MPPILITEADIQAANQLSLHCPICAGAVENHTRNDATRPVVCEACGTLYHKACWEQAGGKCAILGCDHQKYYFYGHQAESQLKLTHKDMPRVSPNGRSGASQRTRDLKHQQRLEVEELNRPTSLLARLFRWLLDQIKIG